MTAMEERFERGELADVRSVELVGDHQLRLAFSDGLVREIDFSDEQWQGVLEPLRDPAFFAQVRVDHDAGTVVWPDELDLAPDTLHGDFEPEFSVGRLIREFRTRAG